MSDNPPSLADSVLQLHRRLHGAAPTPAIEATLREIVASDGFDTHTPPWFSELFVALAHDDDFSERTIPHEQFFDRRFDITDFLAQLAEASGIPRVHEGEFSVMSFDSLKVSLCLDFETPGGVGVRLMRWPHETGPYLHRWPPGDPRNRTIPH